MGLNETTQSILNKIQIISDSKEKIYNSLIKYANNNGYNTNAISGNFDHYNTVLNNYLSVANNQKEQVAKYLHSLDNSLPETINMPSLLLTVKKYVNKIQEESEVPAYYINFIEGTTNILFIPKGTTNIRSNLLNSNNLIQYIEWDNGLTSISLESVAFYNSALIELTIPEAVVSCGSGLCQNVDSLVEVTWKSKIDIPSDCFRDCSFLTKFICTTEGMTEIGSNAFNVCYELSEIQFPSTLKKIRSGAFSGCQKLTSFYFPEGLTHIANAAFYNSGLTSLNLPESLISIGQNAFYYSKITDLILGSNLEELIQSAFQACYSLQHVEIKSQKLTIIGASVFKSCRALEDVILPNNITTIGAEAFYECTSLSKILNSSFEEKLPEMLEVIGNSAFYKAPLTEIVFPEHITTIGNSAFYMTQLLTIEIPKTITSLGSAVFSNTPLTKATIGVENLSNSLFSSCKSLKEVVAMEDISFTAIGNYCFSGCSMLEAINSDNVTSVGSYAFKDCTALKVLNLPSIEQIGDYAFQNVRLESLTLGPDFTAGSYLVDGATVTELNFLGTIEQWCTKTFSNQAANPIYASKKLNLNGNLLTTIDDNSTEVLGDYIFNYLHCLTTARFNKVTTLGLRTFWDCTALTTVHLPLLQTTGYYTFYNCTNLQTVELGSYQHPVTKIGSYSFSGVPSTAKIIIWTNGGGKLSGSPWSGSSSSIVFVDSNKTREEQSDKFE